MGGGFYRDDKMKLKSIRLLLLSTAAVLLVACGDTQTADTPTLEAKVVAGVEAEHQWGVGGLVEDLEAWATIELPRFITA